MKNKDKNLNDYAYCPNSCPVISKSQTEAIAWKRNEMNIWRKSKGKWTRNINYSKFVNEEDEKTDGLRFEEMIEREFFQIVGLNVKFKEGDSARFWFW